VEGRFYVTKKGVKVWESPSGGWSVATMFKTRDLRDVEEFMAKMPAGAAGLEVFKLMLTERGTWMGFGVWFGRVERVVFTKNTKVVLIDKAGGRYESDGIFFYPDLMQTSLYDSRKSPVVVSQNSVMCHSKSDVAIMEVRFAGDGLPLKEVVTFEVIGAIEDSTKAAGR
jgi:hypothetical protein